MTNTAAAPLRNDRLRFRLCVSPSSLTTKTLATDDRQFGEEPTMRGNTVEEQLAASGGYGRARLATTSEIFVDSSTL